ncbi:MAG: hypothetical protein HY904_23430 [Deltaproteobacteria bacterium]|nr:hypothetical protein [Deltaproteobacteria bacterium]
MQVGGVSHGWGASRLWHDPNYEIQRDYRPIPVQRGIMQGEALPKEDHLLPPEKPQDPFTAQEAAYDVAHAQATRGVEGQKMLHGRNDVAAFDAAVTAARERGLQADVTRTLVANPLHVGESMPTGNVRPQQVAPAAPGQVVKPEGASQTQSGREASRAAQDARDTSSVVDAVALAAGGFMSAAGAAKAAGAVASVTVNATAALSAGASTAGSAAVLAANDHPDIPVDPDGSRKH